MTATATLSPRDIAQLDVARVPYALHTAPDIEVREQRCIFEGRAWVYVGLDLELAGPGSFKTTWVGSTPVIVLRDEDGEIRVLVNRCAHKGSLICFQQEGTAKTLSCPYHNWVYDLKGDLERVAFANGVRGKGGLPADFDYARNGLRRLSVAIFAGLIFASFDPSPPAIEEYLGSRVRHHIRRTIGRPMKIIGTYRQQMHNNWKLYMENTRDSYHASLLHVFFTTFRLNRLDMEGGMAISENQWNSISYTESVESFDDAAYNGNRALQSGTKLADPSMVKQFKEFDDRIVSSITSVFPNLIMQQIGNSLAVRQLIPRGPGECELVWILLGAQDDDQERHLARIKQANLVGPAGLVSLEDGIIGNFIQRGIRHAAPGDKAVIRMGGDEVASVQSRVTETAVRGFWKAYRDCMGDPQ
ncbi:Rieske 2Fe-2S domain-containing protein [Pigmentiphaga soli]|uniref:Rieske 2Fe-2S domain-containing protein n=1 Tax=Pigmentiphaga soli TaxID=1007095 RepID=A0ABP8H6Y3_9BURK